MKTRIPPMPLPNEKPYSHLLPMVDALLREGNEPVTPEVFFQDRDGWRCELRRPIDFELIRNEFDLPSSIILSDENDAILCENTWIEIKGGSDVVMR